MHDGVTVDRTAAAEGRLAFKGVCTPEATARVEEALGEVLGARPSEVVLDLTGMTYFSSSCIGSLVAFADEAWRIGAAVAILAAGKVGQMLEMAGVGNVPNVRLEVRHA